MNDTTMTVQDALALAMEHHRAGRLPAAGDLYRRILQAQPDNIDATYLLGLVERHSGDKAAAIALLGDAFSRRPDAQVVRDNLQGAGAEALQLARTAHSSGELARAEKLYRAVLTVWRDHAEAWHLLGMTLFQSGRSDEGVRALQRSLACDPAVLLHHMNLAHVLRAEGDIDGATLALDRALALQPGSIECLLRQAITQLPSVYDSMETLEVRRAAYARRLQALHDHCLGAPAAELAIGADAVAVMQPYLLPYQGRDDSELQILYGRTVCRLMAARYPQYAQPLAMPPRDPDGRLRIGIVSGHFFGHSVWKIPVKGWVQHLPRDRFRLFGYSTTTRRDACTLDAMRMFDRYVEGLPDVERLAAAITEDRLHVLLYPEIGMDPLTARLSALRLAPVQAVSLGHPETTGQPTIDDYLTSDLMEPEDGTAAYTERLVRLPNLATCYEPLAIEDSPITRAGLGVRDGAVAYWCCQFMPKYRPDRDPLFARIAAGVTAAGGDCQFVFISNMSTRNRGIFEGRMARAFAAQGLDWRRHCVIHTWLGAREFTAAIKLMDVFLDSLDWSGNNTTMESLGGCLPVVTFPQRFMRGRHAYGILRLMGVTDTVASSEDEYVDIAVRLARDPAWRAEVAAKMRAARPRAYDDRACVAGLADYLSAAGAAAPLP